MFTPSRNVSLPPLVLPSAPPSRGKLGLKHLKDILEKILRVAHFLKPFSCMVWGPSWPVFGLFQIGGKGGGG
jgi:hypothetical protein